MKHPVKNFVSKHDTIISSHDTIISSHDTIVSRRAIYIYITILTLVCHDCKGTIVSYYIILGINQERT